MQTLEEQLFDAASQGNTRALQKILSSGVDLSQIGITALLEAAYYGHSEIVQMLLEHKVDMEVAPAQGIYGFGAGTNALGFAIVGGHIETVGKLVDSGANLNTADYEHTPLIVAIFNKENRGNGDIISLLLRRGAAPNIPPILAPSRQKTPLMYAAYLGDAETVQLLLEHGADVDATDNIDRTALMIAVCNGHTDVVRVLLANGADPEVTTPYGDTAMLLAENGQYPDIMELLRQDGK